VTSFAGTRWADDAWNHILFRGTSQLLNGKVTNTTLASNSDSSGSLFA
jgi:hypothetical protein